MPKSLKKDTNDAISGRFLITEYLSQQTLAIHIITSNFYKAKLNNVYIYTLNILKTFSCATTICYKRNDDSN